MARSGPIVTYAQYNEDIILSALLHDVKEGFYVDIGANHPKVDSVTKFFYERGWRGINIEPIESLHRELVKGRPKDINLNCGVGLRVGTETFREYIDIPGHSTFDAQLKKEEDRNRYKDYKVRIRTLANILNEHKPHHIHFLKIDVEGYEYDVIAGNDWNQYRPEIICVEANHVSKDWKKVLQQNSYKLFISDGLNEYYVATGSWDRTGGFAERVTELSYKALKQHHRKPWLRDQKEVQRLAEVSREREKIIHRLDARLREVEPLSLKNRNLKERLKIALYGLTVDWHRFKKRTKKSRR